MPIVGPDTARVTSAVSRSVLPKSSAVMFGLIRACTVAASNAAIMPSSNCSAVTPLSIFSPNVRNPLLAVSRTACRAAVPISCSPTDSKPPTPTKLKSPVMTPSVAPASVASFPASSSDFPDFSAFSYVDVPVCAIARPIDGDAFITLFAPLSIRKAVGPIVATRAEVTGRARPPVAIPIPTAVRTEPAPLP